MRDGGDLSCVPLILYWPLSWLWRLEMLTADEALEPTVSMRSNPGGVLSPDSMAMGGRKAGSSAGRRVKGLRMGIFWDVARRTESGAPGLKTDPEPELENVQLNAVEGEKAREDGMPQKGW